MLIKISRYSYFCSHSSKSALSWAQLTVHDHGSEEGEESLGVENTIWAGAVLASGTATGPPPLPLVQFLLFITARGLCFFFTNVSSNLPPVFSLARCVPISRVIKTFLRHWRRVNAWLISLTKECTLDSGSHVDPDLHYNQCGSTSLDSRAGPHVFVWPFVCSSSRLNPKGMTIFLFHLFCYLFCHLSWNKKKFS